MRNSEELAHRLRTRNDVIDYIRALKPAYTLSNPYFLDAARLVLEAVFISLMEQQPGNWTIRELMEATRSIHSVRSRLSTTPRGRDTLKYVLNVTEPADLVAKDIFVVLIDLVKQIREEERRAGYNLDEGE